MVTIGCLATGLAYLYQNLEQTIPQQVHRELILLSAFAVKNTCLISELALNNSELSHLYGKDILLSFTTKAKGIENAGLVLT